MNKRFRTAKPLPIRTFVLLTNQQQIDGVSKKLIPQKTGPYLILKNQLIQHTYYKTKIKKKLQSTEII